MHTSAQGDRDLGELLPIISAVSLLGVVVISGFDYRLIDQGATLLFYAVMIQIWNSDFGNPAENGNHLVFLAVSIGAVGSAYFLELIFVEITGGMLAIQAVALALLISRIYVNQYYYGSFRWNETIDRYVFYIPCLTAVLLPILLALVEIRPILGFDPNSLLVGSQNSFLTIGFIAVMVGFLIYTRLEEDRKL